jgi:hypothetical protein
MQHIMLINDEKVVCLCVWLQEPDRNLIGY